MGNAVANANQQFIWSGCADKGPVELRRSDSGPDSASYRNDDVRCIFSTNNRTSTQNEDKQYGSRQYMVHSFTPPLPFKTAEAYEIEMDAVDQYHGPGESKVFLDVVSGASRLAHRLIIAPDALAKNKSAEADIVPADKRLVHHRVRVEREGDYGPLFSGLQGKRLRIVMYAPEGKEVFVRGVRLKALNTYTPPPPVAPPSTPWKPTPKATPKATSTTASAVTSTTSSASGGASQSASAPGTFVVGGGGGGAGQVALTTTQAPSKATLYMGIAVGVVVLLVLGGGVYVFMNKSKEQSNAKSNGGGEKGEEVAAKKKKKGKGSGKPVKNRARKLEH
jgi:hypothetical protein